MRLLAKHLPTLPTRLSLLGLTLGLAALVWNAAAPLPYPVSLIALGLAVISGLLLLYWAWFKMGKLSVKLSGLWGHIQQHRSLLQAQVSQVNRDLRMQREMLQALQGEGALDRVMQLALELTGVSHASCWTASFHHTAGGSMQCIKSVAKENQPLFVQNADVWKEEDFAKFFQMLREETPIIYPEAHWNRNHRAPLGNLLYYIDNNSIKALLIVPIKTSNGATGVIWLEDRQRDHSWSERSINQAAFIADLIHLELARRQRKNIIHELSNEAHRLDALQEATASGWGWYKLKQYFSVAAAPAIQAIKLAEATLEEAIPQFLDTTAQSLQAPLSNLLTEEVMDRIVARNYAIEDELFQKNGRYWECDAIGVWQGQDLLGIWVSVKDVTEREQERTAQQALIQRFEKSSNILTEVDGDNKIIFDTPNIQSLGYEPGSRLRHGLPSYVHEEDLEALELALWQCRRHQTPEDCPGLRVRQHLGGFAFFDARLTPAPKEGHILVEFIDASLRKKEEERLKSEKRFMENVLSQSHEAIAVIGLDERLGFLSENWEELFGHPATDRKGRYALEYFHRQHTTDLSKGLQRILEGDSERHIQEAEFLSRKGKWLRVQVGLYALRNEREALQGVVMRMAPASKEAKEVARLRNRESLTRTFINADDRAYLLLGANGVVRFASENVAKTLGFLAKEILGQPLLPLIKEQQAFKQNLKIWDLTPGARHEAHFSVKHKNGTQKALHLVCLGKVSNEAYSGLMIMLEEPLSEASPAESQVELRADFFMGLANSLPFPVWFINRAGTVKFGNQEARDWLGFLPSGGVQSFMDSKSAQALQSIDEEQGSQPLRLRLKDHKGGYWQAHALATPLKGSMVKGTLLMLPPPSNMAKELEKELELAEREVQRLLSLKKHLEDKQQGWKEELEKKRQAMIDMQKDKDQDAKYLSDRMELLQSALVSKNHEINSLEARLHSLMSLRKQGERMQKHFEDLRELLFLFDGASPDTDWESKWKEIQNFKKIINYQGALRFARSYLATLQEALEESAGTEAN